MASLPLEDRVPINGVATGPRSVQWRPSEPATLMWVEALDGGDLKNKVPNRDRIVALKAPFTGEPREVFKTEQRFSGIQMAAKGGLALVEDSERRTRRVRTFQIDLDNPGEPRLIWSRNSQDRYSDPGRPIDEPMPNGGAAILQDGDNIFLTGLGASPKGDHPFLDRFNLATQKSERLFQCDDDHYETVVALLDDHGAQVPDPPREPHRAAQLLRAHSAGGQMTAVTKFPDPQPIFRKVTQAAGHLQTPRRRAAFLHALPAARLQAGHAPAHPHLGLSAASTTTPIPPARSAAPPSASPKSPGYSQLFHVLDGFAVLDNAAMPVVGDDPDTVNNTYIEQIVADAKAAIDKAAEMGVTDPSARRRGRPQLRRVHDRQPAGALRSVQGRHRRERRAQPHPDAVRLPERAAHALAGAGRLPEDVAVHVRRQDQDADPADPRRGGR